MDTLSDSQHSAIHNFPCKNKSYDRIYSLMYLLLAFLNITEKADFFGRENYLILKINHVKNKIKMLCLSYGLDIAALIHTNLFESSRKVLWK